MPHTELRFSRDYDLPVAIVWDALVDDVLVEGWLAPARIDARLGGEYSLRWHGRPGLAESIGVITAIEPRRHVVVETDNVGTMSFTLRELAGGTRGTSTGLDVLLVVDTEPRLLASTRAHWQSNLDQLESLLRGHPVDWASWESDRGEAWESYRRASD